MPDGAETSGRAIGRPAEDAEPLLLEHPVSRPQPARHSVPARIRKSEPGPQGHQPAPAAARPRHVGAAISFALCVLLPTAACALYLIVWAEDRYSSRVAFSVRSSEPAAAASGMLGALAGVASGPGADASIVDDFLQSQDAVERIGAAVDLEAMFGRAPSDWVFSLGPGRRIEDLTDYWNDAVDVAVDTATGIVDVEARAFRPEDARALTSAVLEASAALVNRLSEDARRDAVRFTEVELRDAAARLTMARGRLQRFRDTEQEVDPAANAAAAIGLVAALERELAEARVALDSLGALDRSSVSVRQLTRRIASLETRIDAERTRLGRGDTSSAHHRSLAHVVGDYETFLAERDFAEQTHALALASHQQAVAEARQHQRFLAVHVAPTRPERSDYPDRPLLIATVFALSLSLWWAGLLIAWNVRDRG